MKKIVLLNADISDSFSNLKNTFKQEWESKDSIEKLKHTIQKLGYSAILIEPKKDYDKLLTICKKIIKEVHLGKIHREEVIFFNLVEGFFSRNREGYIPSIAEFFGFPHTGSDSYAQSITLNKNLCKLFAKKLKIPVKNHFLIRNNEELKKIKLKSKKYFWKPNLEGSGIAIDIKNILSSQNDLTHLEKEINKYSELLIEEYLPGDELTIGVMGNRGKYKATQLAKVTYPGRVYGYAVKSKSKMPERLEFGFDKDQEKKLQGYSIRLSEEIGVSGYARYDFKCDEKGNPYFLEGNLTCGLSIQYSTFPICYTHSFQKKYSDMVEEILNLAVEEFKEKRFLYGKMRLE
ncbi:MAG: D-alanine--D-alanine ligase [Leptospiraceae bacterium]|nr:D-alanine--D-alanine ligase [Leptospiraceae bacterium]MCK6380563.1 D-alanine--D-alanine ligase [Leptospiraceae bacterium]NUM40734.1 D-alanine--D-alanine ligase [Leptospiraceae bacterium]